MFSIRTFVFRPSDQQLAKGNLLFAALVAGSVPLIGSGISFLVGVTAAWGLLLLAFNRVELRAGREVRIAGLLFALFYAAEFLSGLIDGMDWPTLSEAAEALVFLAILPLFALMRVDRDKLALLLPRFAAAGALMALAVAISGTYGTDGRRLALSCGNPGVLALVASVMYGLALSGAMNQSGVMRASLLVGAAAAAVVVILTGMRVFWPVLVLLPVLFALLAIRSRVRAMAAALALCGLTGALAVGAYEFSPLVRIRVAATLSDIHKIEKGQMDNSIGMRLVIWQTALELIAEKPVFGHGAGHVGERMLERNIKRGGHMFAFSHYHNAILTEMIRAGVVGTGALLAAFFYLPFAAFRRLAKEGDRQSVARAFALVIPYAASGATGLMLGHDVMDAVYVGLLVILLALHGPQAASRNQAA